MSPMCQGKCVFVISKDLIAEHCVIVFFVIKLENEIWWEVGYFYWLGVMPDNGWQTLLQHLQLLVLVEELLLVLQ